jgi:hypothetical protein
MYPGKVDTKCYENENDHHRPLKAVIGTQFCKLFDLIAKSSPHSQLLISYFD